MNGNGVKVFAISMHIKRGFVTCLLVMMRLSVASRNLRRLEASFGEARERDIF